MQDLIATLVQTELAWEKPADNRQQMGDIIAALEDPGDLIVLPEMWTTSFLVEPSVSLIRSAREAERSMTRLSEELQVMIIGGGLEEDLKLSIPQQRLDDRRRLLAGLDRIKRSVDASGALELT